MTARATDQDEAPAGIVADLVETLANVRIEVGLCRGLGAPGAVLFERHPEPGRRRGAQCRCLGLVPDHRTCTWSAEAMALDSSLAHSWPAGNSGVVSRSSESTRSSVVASGRSGAGTFLGSGIGPAMAPMGVDAGRPEPSRFPEASGRSSATPLAAAALAGVPPTHPRTRVSSPRRKRWQRTPPVARPLAGYSAYGVTLRDPGSVPGKALEEPLEVTTTLLAAGSTAVKNAALAPAASLMPAIPAALRP